MTEKTNAQITVVIVTYNSSKHIVSLLNSLEKTSLIREIYIVENNSREARETHKLVLNYKVMHSTKKITFIHSKKNNGFGKSCNKGANESKGKYILFINPDTIVLPNSISILYSHASNGNADLIGGKSVTFTTGKRHLTVVRRPNLNIGLFEFSNLGKIFLTQCGHIDFYYLNFPNVIKAKRDIEVDALGGAYLLVKRSAFERLGGFDEKFFMYLEDVDLSVRAKKLGMKVVYCPHSVIKHIGGASSDNKYKIRHQAWFDSRKYYFKKHFGFLTNLLIQPLYTTEEYLLKKIKRI